MHGPDTGEQPDRGIAGRNSSADDEKERDPPGAFFYLGLGPTSGRRSVPTPGFGFDFETPSDQKDSAMPSKTHTGGPRYGWKQKPESGGEGIVANSPWR